jgi:tRNA threonylcarbamoyl adenosine modification protein (Sua5/YciO/YrdC/YwlC family)
VTGDPVSEAARAARGGSLIVFPTDTVYGLGTTPNDPDATARLFAAKARPERLTLPILVPSTEVAHDVGRFDERAERLAQAFWPGALSLVLPRAPSSAPWALGGDADTVAVRVPAHPLARALLAEAGPLAVTSANRSGEPPATTCDGLRRVFGDLVAVYLCEEAPLEGAASTVLDLAHGPATILRSGDLEVATLARFLPAGEPLLDSPPSP